MDRVPLRTLFIIYVTYSSNVFTQSFYQIDLKILYYNFLYRSIDPLPVLCLNWEFTDLHILSLGITVVTIN